jgi:hypothetical protein
MKILKLEQGSPEWEEFRKSHVGASDMGILMTGTDREINDLLKVKRGLKQVYVTEAMQDGKDKEHEAIEKFLGRARKDGENPTALADKPNDWLMASFDFLNQVNYEIIEVKRSKVHCDSVAEHHSYAKWYWQVQAQMKVSGYTCVTLLLHNTITNEQMHEVIDRNEEDVDLLIARGKWFMEKLDNFEFLPGFDAPEERTDPNTIDWATRFKEVDQEIKELEEERDVLRAEGIAIANEASFMCNGIKVEKVKSRTTIDYKAACSLNNIDLKDFEKVPKVPYTWKFTPVN